MHVSVNTRKYHNRVLAHDRQEDSSNGAVRRLDMSVVSSKLAPRAGLGLAPQWHVARQDQFARVARGNIRSRRVVRWMRRLETDHGKPTSACRIRFDAPIRPAVSNPFGCAPADDIALVPLDLLGLGQARP